MIRNSEFNIGLSSKGEIVICEHKLSLGSISPGKSHYRKPELLDFRDNLQELFQVKRFSHESIRMQVVGLEEVFLIP